MSGAFVWAGLLIVVGAITVLSGIVSIARRLQRQGPDPAWKATTPIQKYTGYDQDKAIASKRRAAKLEETTRKIAAERSRPRSQREPREPRTPREPTATGATSSNVVQIEKKRGTR